MNEIIYLENDEEITSQISINDNKYDCGDLYITIYDVSGFQKKVVKQQAFFDGPSKPLNPKAFLKKLAQQQLKPSPQSRILSLGKVVYCNGDEVTKNQDPKTISAWNNLSANKCLQTSALNNIEGSSLYEAYLAWWLIFNN